MRCAVLALLVACSSGVPARHTQPGEVEFPRPLGGNDVSILLPLPGNVDRPVIAGLGDRDGALVGRRWFDVLVTAHGDIGARTGGAIAFEDFQVVAVRFDLCDRSAIGPCPAGTTGRLRLVLQPLYARAGATFAHDV